MKRYYLANSAWFNTHSYDIDKIKSAIKVAGGKNIRTSNCFGWSNQPKVVTFNYDGSRDEYLKIYKSLSELLETPWLIISEKGLVKLKIKTPIM